MGGTSNLEFFGLRQFLQNLKKSEKKRFESDVIQIIMFCLMRFLIEVEFENSRARQTKFVLKPISLITNRKRFHIHF